jgi:hypothetical protein
MDQLLTINTLLRYDWRNKQDVELKRGRALIFCDKDYSEAASKLGKSFEYLNYWTRTLSLEEIQSALGKYSIVCGGCR